MSTHPSRSLKRLTIEQPAPTLSPDIYIPPDWNPRPPVKVEVRKTHKARVREGWRLQKVRPHGDVGRNDPCPCGSGKKLKKCCLL
jgi:preprotein translocase subunit SecA